MPVAFQVGLFCTVLAFAVVRFLRSLRLVVRSGRGAAQAPAMVAPPGPPATGSHPPDPQAAPGGQVDLRKSGWAIPAIRPDAKGAARAIPAESPEQESSGGTKGGGAGAGTRARSRFNWERWYHLAVLWGLVLFCGPFLFGLAAPGRMREASLALDTRIAGGPPVPDLASLRERVESAQSAGRFTGLTPQVFRVILAEALASGALAEELEVFAELSAREVRKAWLMLLAGGAAVAAAGIASGLAARRRSVWATWTFAAAGVVAACGAFALAGPVATRLSGALAAREAIKAYASTLTVPAGKAGGLSGPVRLVGRPSPGALSGAGPAPGALSGAGARYFYYRGPGEGGEGSAVYAGFRLGAVTVAACSPSDCRVVRPHVRLGSAGREHFIGAEENVVVMGVLRDGVLRPRRGYPLVVAPAGEAAYPAPGGARALAASPDERRWMRQVMEAVADDLAGTGARRARWLALLQAAFGSALAWSMALLAASATERLLGPPRPLALPAGRKKGEIAETS
ncbi:MAG: hypothetical protein ACYSU0_02540 [Planctomycetota bacterium]|jgi:hypothetical protein